MTFGPGDDVLPIDCTHPQRRWQMICSTCGILLHDSANAVPVLVYEYRDDAP